MKSQVLPTVPQGKFEIDHSWDIYVALVYQLVYQSTDS